MSKKKWKHWKYQKFKNIFYYFFSFWSTELDKQENFWSTNLSRNSLKRMEKCFKWLLFQCAIYNEVENVDCATRNQVENTDRATDAVCNNWWPLSNLIMLSLFRSMEHFKTMWKTLNNWTKGMIIIDNIKYLNTKRKEVSYFHLEGSHEVLLLT